MNKPKKQKNEIMGADDVRRRNNEKAMTKQKRRSRVIK